MGNTGPCAPEELLARQDIVYQFTRRGSSYAPAYYYKASVLLVMVAAALCAFPLDIGRAFAQTTPSDNTGSLSVDENDQIGSDVVTLIAGIKEAHRRGDGNRRNQLTNALGKRGPDAIPALINLLEFEGAIVRGQAAYFLGNQGGRATPALPSWIRCLSDSDRRVYGAAARAILGIKGQNGPIFLADIVVSQDKPLRLETARLLGVYTHAYPRQRW